jgi:hypothetical protein
MAENKIPSDPQGLMALADHIINGNGLAAGQPYELAAARAALEAAHQAVIVAEGAKEQAVGDGSDRRAEGTDTIARVKTFLHATLPEGKEDERLQDYLLDQPAPDSYDEILDTLQAIMAANTAAAGEAWELNADLTTKAGTHATAMEAQRIATQASKGVYHEAIQTRKGTLTTLTVHSRKSRDLLYATLPQGKKDMLLKEFGFDPWD